MKDWLTSEVTLSVISFLLMIPTVILIVLVKVWERRNDKRPNHQQRTARPSKAIPR